MLHRVLAILAILSAAALAPTAVFARGAEPVHAASAPRLGQLPNGLRYAIAAGRTPAGAVSVRLGLDIGSYDEADDERGVAHFVEHMAFNGSRRFKEGEVDRLFAKLGMGSGRDQNAFTGQTTTVYHLDLPGADAERLDAAFAWLRDAADALTFDPAAVARERGVVEAERRSRLHAGSDWLDRAEAFRLRGLRSPERQAIGTAESIGSMTAERLRRFYDRWYRPEHAVVVIVGDIEPAEAERRIREAFGDWKGMGPAGVRAPRVGPAGERGLDILVETDDRSPYTALVCRAGPPDPDERDVQAEHRRDVLRALNGWILQRRLRPVHLPGGPLREADATFEVYEDVRLGCMALAISSGRTMEALGHTQGVLAAFLKTGPTETELEIAIDNYRAGLRGSITEAPTATSRDRATDLAYQLLAREAPRTPADRMRLFNVVAVDLVPEDLRKRFEQDWSGWGPIITATAPVPLKEAELRAAWAGQAAKAVAAAAQPGKWPYKLPRPGEVVERTVASDTGHVRLRFANGLLVNFKQTDFSAGEVDLRVVFGSGRQELAVADYIAADLGAALFLEGGAGRLSHSEIATRMGAMEWSAELSVGQNAFELDAHTFDSGLTRQLVILATLLDDPGFRPEMDVLLKDYVDDLYRGVRTDPAGALAHAFGSAVAPGKPLSMPPREALAGLDSKAFGRILRRPLTTSPLELTVVGDVTEAAVVESVAATLGALPARRGRPPAPKDSWALSFPAPLPSEPVLARHQGPPDQAVAALYWPLFVSNPSRAEEQAALRLVGEIFEQKLTERIREQLGRTYSPEAGVWTPAYGHQGYFWASLQTEPAVVDRVRAEVRSLADGLARGQLSEDDLEAARRPLLTGLDQQRATNAWWLERLSVRNPASQAEFAARRDRIAKLTLQQVRAVARTWLSTPHLTVLALPASQTGDRP